MTWFVFANSGDLPHPRIGTREYRHVFMYTSGKYTESIAMIVFSHHVPILYRVSFLKNCPGGDEGEISCQKSSIGATAAKSCFFHHVILSFNPSYCSLFFSIFHADIYVDSDTHLIHILSITWCYLVMVLHVRFWFSQSVTVVYTIDMFSRCVAHVVSLFYPLSTSVQQLDAV